jgi:hypothetical protein
MHRLGLTLIAALLAAFSTLAIQPAYAITAQLLTNGGFESGNLAGWTTSGLGSNTCSSGGQDWNVAPVSSTGCTVVAPPAVGTFAAYVMNDGFAGTNYILSQQFSVAAGLTSATLSFVANFVAPTASGRKLTVGLYKNTTLLGNVAIIDTSGGPTPWLTWSIDVSALLVGQVGSDFSLRFTNSIPVSWTGPGGLGLDNVSLLANFVAVPAPAGAALLGTAIGLLGWLRLRRGNRRLA